MRVSGAIAAFLLILAEPRARSAETPAVDTILLMAVDVSLSVDEGRYQLQKNGIAAALESPETLAAIQSGPTGSVAVAVMEYSDPDRQILVLPWTHIDSAETAHEAAEAVRASRRSSAGLTDLAEALLAGDGLVQAAPFSAGRRIIDISSDGMSNIGSDMETARDRVVGDGITVNGLPILSEEPWLEDYYDRLVIGGDNAFLEPAKDLDSFADAMRRKLSRELLVSDARGPISR